MRTEQDSLVELQASIQNQERAYTNALIELYGTPYTDDIGPGKTYKQGYAGPDFFNFALTDKVEFDFPDMWNYSSKTKWEIPIMDLPRGYTSWIDEWITFRPAPIDGVTPGADSGVNTALVDGDTRFGVVVKTNVVTYWERGVEITASVPSFFFSLRTR